MTDADCHPPQTWLTALESRRRFALISIVLLAVATLFVSSLRNPVDYDGYWHLRMGMDWVENGLSPWQDHYSFTFNGEKITGPPVAFQVLLWEAVKHLGERGGFVAVKLAAFFLVFGMMLGWLRQVCAPALVWLLVLAMLVNLIQLRAQVRPELFSYAFTIGALMLYHRARLRLSFSAIAPIALLLLVWTNYHSPVVGYVIFFGLFVDIGLRLVRERAGPPEWLKWAGWGVVLVGIGFLNPSFSHPVLRMVLFPSEWKDFIQEYRTPDTHLKAAWIYVLFLITALTVWLSARQRRVGYLIIAAVVIYAGMTMSRMVAPAGIAMLCLFADVFTAAHFEQRLPAFARDWQRGLALLVGACFLVTLLSSVRAARAMMNENRTSWAAFPSQLADYMRDNGLHGRIYNAYQMGGYLIWRLAPESQVYIDGRTGILYPVAHFREMLESNSTPEAMQATADRYDIDYAVIENDGFTVHVMQEAGFELEYADVRYLLYRRGEGSFALTGRLAARPWCWDDREAGAILNQQRQALLLMSPAAPVQTLAHLAAGYVDADDRRAWLQRNHGELVVSNYDRRFLAFRALENDLPEVALHYLQRLTEWSPQDYLARSLAELRLGRPDDAEATIDAALRKRWVHIDFTDVVVQYRLLREIRAIRPFKLLEDSLLDGLKERVGDSAGDLSRPVGAVDFCAAGQG